MVFIFAIPEVVIGAVLLVIFCAIFAGGMIISYFWANLLFYAGMICFIPAALAALFFYLMKAEDFEKSKYGRYFLKWLLSFPFPFALTIYIKKTVVNHYTFSGSQAGSPSGTMLLYLLLAMIILTAILALASWFYEYIGAAIIAITIILVLLPSTKYKIAETMSKLEVAKVISYTDVNRDDSHDVLIKEEFLEEYLPDGFTIKTTTMNGVQFKYITNNTDHNNTVVNGSGKFHYYALPTSNLPPTPVGFPSTEKVYVSLDGEGKIRWNIKTDCKKLKWISRYELMQQQGISTETLLQYD